MPKKHHIYLAAGYFSFQTVHRSSAAWLVQIAKKKLSYRANKLPSGPEHAVIARERVMKASADHSTPTLLMHVKRTDLVN